MIAILVVIILIVYGLLLGFSGEGSKIIDGNVEENSFIGKGVDIIENTVENLGEEDSISE